MPSLFSASQGPSPAAVKGGSSYPMLFAASSAFLRAAGVEISGLGRPLGTATAVRMLATEVALLGRMAPDATAPGKGAIRSETPSGWPLATIGLVSAPLPYVTLTL